MSERTRKVSGWLGRSFLAIGSLTLLFAAFQLWGTGIAEGRAQDRLADQFAAELAERPRPTTPPVTAAPSTVPVPTTEDSDPAPVPFARTPGLAPPVSADEIPPVGNALGLLRIPAIDVEKVLIEGIGRDELRHGPGHYPDTALPGQTGNAAIAGHRTTYGAPFGDIDLLEPGDTIEVETFQGTFSYEVLPQSAPDGSEIGHRIIEPTDTWVVQDYGDNRLTLTACHPKYSARQRIVVQASLITPEAVEPAPAAVTPPVTLPEPDVAAPVPAELPGESIPDEGNTVSDDADGLAASLGWHWQEAPRLILWSLLTLGVAIAAIAGARRIGPRWAYLGSSPVLACTLWFAFTHLDRMLPAF